jgi:AraC family transcriptional regulator, regulatory protein of adaptative response / DNA-3-methyladenine glycosylase II
VPLRCVRGDRQVRFPPAPVTALGLNWGMTLESDTCYRAVAARDPRFDGRFFTGVTSTGVYCRPICPSRTPARENMRFFPHQGAAEAAGFRACRRCRPEASPGSPDWNTRRDLVARAVRLISDGYVDEHGIGGLARRLAVTERHLHRLVVAELGTGPLTLARTVRLQTARRLLIETSVPITEIAFASGFSSVRQFNASFQESYRQPPSALRGGARSRGATAGSTGTRGTDAHGTDAHGTGLSLRLACREPFDGASLLGFLAGRAIPGVEQVTAGTYTRTIRTPAGSGVIELLPGPPGQGHVLLRVRLAGLGGVGQVVSRCRQLFDLDADPAAIGSALAGDRILAPLVHARPGLRIPGAYDGFELAVRAVLGQQVSVPAARTFAARLAVRHGTPLCAASADGHTTGDAAASYAVVADGARPAQPAVLFPGPDQLADADLSGLGFTTSRQATLRALAGAMATGRLELGPGADPADAAARLSELPGIGPWTVSYILMRAVGDPDAFPETDLGLRRAMERLGCPSGQARHWRPWRGYAALHLWTWAAGPGPLLPARPRTAGTGPARPEPAGPGEGRVPVAGTGGR